MSPLHKQLVLLGTLRALRMFMISVPVIAIYWNGFGLGVFDIMLLQVIFSIAWVSLELPSGYLADRYGNKLIILAGCIASAVGYLVYWQSPGYLGFVIAELLLALSASLVSGARDALLRNSLDAHGVGLAYRQYHGQLERTGFISEAVSGLAAGLVVIWFPLGTVLAIQFFVMVVSIPVALQLVAHNEQQQPARSLQQIIRYCFIEHTRLLWFNVMVGAISASTLTMFWYTQLHWQSIGVPLWWFGPLFAGLMLVAYFGSKLTETIATNVTSPQLYLGLVIAPVILYLLMGSLAGSLWSLSILWAFWFIRGITMSNISYYIQHETSADNRATVISAQQFVMRGMFSAVVLPLGYVAQFGAFQMGEWERFQRAFLLSAIVFGALGLLGYRKWVVHEKRRTL